MKIYIKLIASFMLLQFFTIEAAAQGFKLPWNSGVSYYVSRHGNPAPPGGPGSTCYSGNYGYTPHNYIAIDFDSPNNVYDPVRAVKAGTVIFAGWHGTQTTGYGKLVKIRHSDNTQTYYAHNQTIFVSVGQVVQQGCLLADGGTTGNSTGDHIHFEWKDAGGATFSDKRYPTFIECSCKVKAKYCYKSTNTTGACSGTPCAAPSNDNCSSATTLTSNGAILSGTVKCATTSYGPNQCSGCNCTSQDDNDVYYKFVAQATTHTVTLSNYSSNFDGVIELRTACAMNTSLGCYDPSGVPASVVKAFSGLTVGSTYYVRIYTWNNSSSPPSSPTFKVKVTHTCTKPSNISAASYSGAQTACTGNSKTYSVTPVTGATSYTWTLPSGWTGSSTTNSITTTVGSSSGEVKVKANNTCGSSNLATKQVTVSTTPAVPGTISGSITVCKNSSQTYSISPVPGAASYTWTFPTGWSYTGSATSASISAIIGTAGGQVKVKARNACGNSVDKVIQVTVVGTPATPGAISGSTSLCNNATQTYSITPVPGATSYTWTLPSGWTWTGPATHASIDAIANSNGGQVTVVAKNACGVSSAKVLAVTVGNGPAIPGPITGASSLCDLSQRNYSISPVPGAASYTWTLPSGWTGTSTSTLMTTTPSTTNGVITVMANSSCGNSPNRALQVDVTNMDNTVSVNSLELTSNATGVNYQWINCATMQPISGATSQSYSPTQNGNYAVILSQNNCIDTSVCNQFTTLGLSFADQTINLVAYPNPTSNQIVISANGLTNTKHRIVFRNTQGQIFIDEEFKVDNQTLETQFDMSRFPSGLYFMTISSENLKHVFKIEKL